MLDFWWDVHQEGVSVGGYRDCCRTRWPPPKPPFSPLDRFAGTGRLRPYPALQQSAGCRDFVGHRSNQRRDLCFCEQVWPSGRGHHLSDCIPTTYATSPNSFEPGDGEPLNAWITEILVMRQIVTLWDLAQEETIKELSQCIHWYDRGVLYDSHPDLKERILTPH